MTRMAAKQALIEQLIVDGHRQGRAFVVIPQGAERGEALVTLAPRRWTKARFRR